MAHALFSQQAASSSGTAGFAPSSLASALSFGGAGFALAGNDGLAPIGDVGLGPQPGIKDIQIGLRPTELVVRGGHLNRPIVMSKLRVVDGKRFVFLWKSCADLNALLTGRAKGGGRKLASTAVFAHIWRAKEAKKEDMLRAAGGPTEELTSAEQPAEASGLASLDLDDFAEGAGQPPKPKRGAKKAKEVKRLLAKQLPKYAQVELVDAAPIVGLWRPFVLLDGGNSAPALEATEDNLSKLRAWVEHDLLEDRDRQDKGRGRGRAAKAKRGPRGDPGHRQYFTGRRWLEKTPLQAGASGHGDAPRFKRFRTLKRRVTPDDVAEEAADPNL